MASKAVPSFSMTREGETFTTVGDRQDVQERIGKAWHIRFDGRKEETHGPKEVIHMASYTRNDAREKLPEHFTEVFKMLHKEPADHIRVVNSTTGVATQYTKDYVQVAYNIFVLGKFCKATPEVEELLAEIEGQPCR